VKNIISILLSGYAIVTVLILYFFDGTGDSGDSIHHYLFARYAPVHPALFFDHWAKPVFVLLASPFAQVGFVGVKVFNALVTGYTVFLTFKIAQILDLKNPVIAALIVIFAPLNFVLTFSGLTEPLFALFISISLYATLKDRYITAALILSFLPFVRSEGLIIIGVFGLYFLLKKAWKILPLLSIGHIVYSIAGYFVYHDFLWVFNKIPYAHLSSRYGSGKLFHFVEQLNYVIGIPIYILLCIGIISMIWKAVQRNITLESGLLVLLGFLAFFVAHTLFWYLGIFNSMGLNRVFVGVIPLIAIIALVGFNTITEDLLKEKYNTKRILQGVLAAYIFIFPFTHNPAAINWATDMNLSTDQRDAIHIADIVRQHSKPDQGYMFAHPYLSEVLDIDHFDDTQRLNLKKSLMKYLTSGDIVIWESWFAVVENSVTKEYLDQQTDLTHIYTLKNKNTGEIVYSLYKKI